MSVDLFNYTDVLRREVTPLGSTLFTDVSDDDLGNYLSDAFWEAYLDGFLHLYSADVNGLVTTVGGGTDIPRDQIALVVLYAGIKIIRNKLIATNTKFAAKAGPVEYTTENSANLLTEMAKQLQEVKNRLIVTNGYGFGFTNVSIGDAFSYRNASQDSYAGHLSSWYEASFGTTT